MTAFRPPRARSRSRRGYVMLEVATATLVLMAAMVLAVKLVAGVGLEQRAAERRLWAVETVSNLAERLSAEPFDRLDAARARAIAAELKAEAVLPGAEWTAEVGAADPAGKKVGLGLSWKGRSGERSAPVRLTFWVYPEGDRS